MVDDIEFWGEGYIINRKGKSHFYVESKKSWAAKQELYERRRFIEESELDKLVDEGENEGLYENEYAKEQNGVARARLQSKWI